MKFNQIKGRSFVVKGTGRGMKGDKHILIIWRQVALSEVEAEDKLVYI